jgi:multidrug resistance efflux pump
MEKLTADFLNDMAILEEKLAHARLDAETAKQATDSLRQEIAAQQAQLEERQRAHDLTRQQADELARENERLQTLHRSSASPPAVPDEIEANGHAEHDLAVAGVRTSEDSGDWLSFN